MTPTPPLDGIGRCVITPHNNFQNISKPESFTSLESLMGVFKGFYG